MSIEDIKKALLRAFGIADEKDGRIKQGCYLNGRWLSIENVIAIIEKNC